MKRSETLAEYVNRIIREEPGLSAVKAEERAKKEAERRGLEETHKISDATINNIILEKAGNLGIFTVIALAWALARPLEEVLTVVFGLSGKEKGFTDNEFAGLQELHQSLPAEEKKYFTRQIESMRREMQSVKKQKK